MAAADITKEHRQEHREAKAQAELGIARLNSLYAVTGQSHRWRIERFIPPVIERADDWEPAPDDPEHVDTYRPRAMAEDERPGQQESED